MTKEDKQLLLKDLSTRLPYGVKVLVKGKTMTDSICKQLVPNIIFGIQKDVLYVKPYLRPMSSMTEGERKEYESFFSIGEYSCGGSLYGEEYEYIADDYDDVTQSVSLIDWLNTNHFDYRGLIPMGLALESPEDMYKED